MSKFQRSKHIAMWEGLARQWPGKRELIFTKLHSLTVVEKLHSLTVVEKIKRDWLNAHAADEPRPYNDCYACDYAGLDCYGYVDCENCPLVGMNGCDAVDSPYQRLSIVETRTEWQLACIAIRDRPVKAGVKCE